MNIQVDVAIVGAGMVGSLAAAALAKCGFDVAVIESREPLAFDSQQCYDLRVSAVSAASQKMFSAVGAWSAMCEMRVCEFRRMAVWDGLTERKTAFNCADLGEAQLGHIVENRVIQLALWQVLRNNAQVTLCCPATIVESEVKTDHVQLQLDDQRRIKASLVIAADGANSATRKNAGIEIDGEAYEQHALVASIATSLPQQDITWQRFAASGPQAFLPLCGNRASLVWYHCADEIERLKLLSVDELARQIELAFPDQLGGICAIEGVGSFPIRWSHARSYIADRLALVGDAAHTVHPLAGQGVNLGLMDAAALVQVLSEARQQGVDVGKRRVLRRYERWRKGENAVMIKSLDGTHHVFQSEHAGNRALRNFALLAASRVAPLNRLAMRVAMGLAGDVPMLGRGLLPR